MVFFFFSYLLAPNTESCTLPPTHDECLCNVIFMAKSNLLLPNILTLGKWNLANRIIIDQKRNFMTSSFFGFATNSQSTWLFFLYCSLDSNYHNIVSRTFIFSSYHQTSLCSLCTIYFPTFPLLRQRFSSDLCAHIVVFLELHRFLLVFFPISVHAYFVA